MLWVRLGDAALAHAPVDRAREPFDLTCHGSDLLIAPKYACSAPPRRRHSSSRALRSACRDANTRACGQVPQLQVFRYVGEQESAHVHACLQFDPAIGSAPANPARAYALPAVGEQFTSPIVFLRCRSWSGGRGLKLAHKLERSAVFQRDLGLPNEGNSKNAKSFTVSGLTTVLDDIA